MKIIFFNIVLAGVIALVIFGIDYIISTSRVAKNQQEWDEYSKDMSVDEKRDKYFSFCENQRAKYGWAFYYFPGIYSNLNKGEDDE